MDLKLEDILVMMEKAKSLDLDCFEYQDKDVRMKIRGSKKMRAAGLPEHMLQNTTEENTEEKNTAHAVKAPMVGTFYAAPAEGAEPFVAVGDTVKKGQIIGIIEAMKLMNEIEADADGTVREILVSNESMVEYGQPLILIS